MTQHDDNATGVSRRTLFKTAGVGGAALAVGAAPAANALDLGGATTALPLMLARVWATTREQKVLRGEFDDTHNVFSDGSIEVLLWPGDLPRLVASGLRHQVTVKDLVARDASLRATAPGRSALLAPQPGERADYRMPDDFLTDMRDLAARFPTMARVIELPKKTLEGRTVHGLEIATDVARRDGRAVFYLDGIHHAREWPAAEFPIMFAYELLEGYATNARIANLVDNVRTFIVPVMNVDGYRFSRTALTEDVPGPAPIGDAYWRKNRRHEDADLVDAHGVDCNRNYAYAWGDDIGGSSSSKGSETYRGVAPLSEPESQNTSWLMQTYPPAAMVTNHTSGNLVLWAWGDTQDDAPDNDLLEGLGRACAAFNGYTPQKSIDLYETTGTCSDYAYGVLGSIGYTFEHAGSSFHPDYASTIPAQYARNAKAFLLLMEEMCLRPEDRPAGRELPPVLLDPKFSYDPEALHHCVLRGRLVDQQRKPVAGGRVRLEKRFETLLWKDGNGKNPLNRASVPEQLDTEIVSGPDGTFVWSVNPSTRPYLEFQGKTEAYRFTATGPTGEGVARDVVVKRGEVVDLRTLVVG